MYVTGPTLFEVQAKWVLRNPTQFGSLWLSGLLHARLLVFKDSIFVKTIKLQLYNKDENVNTYLLAYLIAYVLIVSIFFLSL